MRIQIQVTNSNVIPDKFFHADIPDEDVTVMSLPDILMASASHCGKVIRKELITGEDSPETAG